MGHPAGHVLCGDLALARSESTTWDSHSVAVEVLGAVYLAHGTLFFVSLQVCLLIMLGESLDGLIVQHLAKIVTCLNVWRLSHDVFMPCVWVMFFRKAVHLIL